MKLYHLIVAVYLFITTNAFSQNNDISTPSNSGHATTAEHPTDYGWNERIGFIVGVGASHLLSSIYENVAIERSGNNVVIEKAGRLRSNVTLGISYTPQTVNVPRTIKTANREFIDYKYYPRGWSYALFINPINITSISNTTFTASDFGAGIGYRTGDVSFLATIEFTSLRQPREYFINKYKDANMQYKVEDNIQTSIDVNDNSIYRSIVKPAIGFKIAYTISIFKSYVGSASD